MWYTRINKEARERNRAAANCSQCILLASTLSRGQDRGLTGMSKQETVEFMDRSIPGWEDWDVEILGPGFSAMKVREWFYQYQHVKEAMRIAGYQPKQKED